MKQKITQILVLAMIMCTSAFAGTPDEKVNKNILAEFTQQFHGARDVNWSSTTEYVKASFQLNGQFLAAYFTNNGVVLGIARNLQTSQLPVTLQSELKKGLSESWISDLFEYSNDEEITYYATIETADQKILMKSVLGSWTAIKKTKKN